MRMFFLLIGVLALAGCGKGKRHCEDLRVGMTKAQLEAKLGTPNHVKVYDARARPGDIYLDVSVYSYRTKMPLLAEPDIVYVDNREDKVIRITCQDKPIRLYIDGSTVPENYLDRWRMDRPAKK